MERSYYLCSKNKGADAKGRVSRDTAHTVCFIGNCRLVVRLCFSFDVLIELNPIQVNIEKNYNKVVIFFVS